MFSGNESFIEELIRDGLGALVLAGLFTVVYFGTRRFLGEAGKSRGRGAAIFAAASICLSLILIVTREQFRDSPRTAIAIDVRTAGSIATAT